MNDGEILNMLLKKKNTTIKALSTMAGIPEQTLYSIKRRKNNSIRNSTKAKISKALNVPVSIWKISDENILIRNIIGINDKTHIVEADKIIMLLQLRNRSVEYIKYALDCMGYNNQYGVKDIENIIMNKVPISDALADDISYILEHDILLTRKELDMLEAIRGMSKESQLLLNAFISRLVKADSYDEMQMEELTDSLNENT